MSNYEKLSDSDRQLIDTKIDENLNRQESKTGFGSNPKLAEENRERFIQKNRDYFTQPENLELLRQNETARQENMAKSLEQYRNAAPTVGGSATTLPVAQKEPGGVAR